MTILQAGAEIGILRYLTTKKCSVLIINTLSTKSREPKMSWEVAEDSNVSTLFSKEYVGGSREMLSCAIQKKKLSQWYSRKKGEHILGIPFNNEFWHDHKMRGSVPNLKKIGKQWVLSCWLRYYFYETCMKMAWRSVSVPPISFLFSRPKILADHRGHTRGDRLRSPLHLGKSVMHKQGADLTLAVFTKPPRSHVQGGGRGDPSATRRNPTNIIFIQISPVSGSRGYNGLAQWRGTWMEWRGEPGVRRPGGSGLATQVWEWVPLLSL